MTTEKVSDWKEAVVERVYYNDSTRAIARVELGVDSNKIMCIKLTFMGRELIIGENMRLLLKTLEEKLEEQGYRW